MIRSTLQTVLVLSFLCFMTGCSLDRAQIISHPSVAKPGDTITVLFSDIYLIISATPTTAQPYTRDSLHTGYGLPAGWSVLSSDYYIANGIRMSQMASLMSDPSLIMNLIQDSLALYTAQKTAMTKDNGWDTYFTGKTFTAHSIANTDSIRVIADSVGQWTAYSGRINLSVPQGTKLDTGISLASLPIDSATRGRISTVYGSDSIWVKAIPIVCFAQIVAGQTEGIDTLMYFTKTGPKPSTGISFIPNYDKGDMTYVPITIAPQNAVLRPLTGRTGSALLRVSPATMTRGSRIAMSIGAAGPWRLSIVDAAGKTMRGFSSSGNGPAGSNVIWDGASVSGGCVQAGIYWAKLESGTAAATHSVRIVK